MFDDSWEHHQHEVNGFPMHYVRAGSGYPLLLLHGWPQSWYAWRRVIPALAEHFTVIAPDLRGAGDSGKPDTGYDKRTMASDCRELMKGLGFDRIGVVGHDWGGSVAFFLAYDNRDLVERLLVLEMIPGLIRQGGSFPLDFVLKSDHIFFHGGDPDHAAHLVGHDVEGYLRRFLTGLAYNYSPAVFTADDIAEYVRVYSAPGALRATFRWYAEGLRADAKNLAEADEKLSIPVLTYGGSHNFGDLRPYWEPVATTLDGGVVPDCGHFIAEERPEFVIEQVQAFFGTAAAPIGSVSA